MIIVNGITYDDKFEFTLKLTFGRDTGLRVFVRIEIDRSIDPSREEHKGTQNFTIFAVRWMFNHESRCAAWENEADASSGEPRSVAGVVAYLRINSANVFPIFFGLRPQPRAQRQRGTRKRLIFRPEISFRSR